MAELSWPVPLHDDPGAVRRFLSLLLILLLAALAAGGAGWWWTTQPLALAADKVEVSVLQRRLAAHGGGQGGGRGVRAPPELLAWYFRLAAAREQTIKPGEYEVTRGMTPGDLLDKLVRGDRIVLAVTLVEGWTFKQFREALAKAEYLAHDTAGLSDAQVMAALGRPDLQLEGRFFPTPTTTPRTRANWPCCASRCS